MGYDLMALITHVIEMESRQIGNTLRAFTLFLSCMLTF